MARTPAMVAVLCAAVVAVSCGSSDGDLEAEGQGPTLTELDAATAEAAASAGVIDAALLSSVAGDDTTWEEESDTIEETDVAECLLSGAPTPDQAAGAPLAVATSDVVVGEDDRGSTSVYVRAVSETLAFATEDDATAAFAVLDADHLVDCLVASNEAITSDEDIEEYGASLLEAEDIDVEELSPVSGGDESVALLARFDLLQGEGDDNTDAAAVHAVRVGPVIEVVWTTRSGEDQSDNPVQEETAGIDAAVADRVEAIRREITPAAD